MRTELPPITKVHAAIALVIVVGVFARPTLADEGGISFWLPGQYGSLVAVPAAPGGAFALIYVHPFSQIGAGNSIPRGGRIDLGVEGSGDLLVLGPSFTFKNPMLGGSATLSLFADGGRTSGSVSGSLTGPSGETIAGHRSESLTAIGDLIPLFSVAWNRGVHNFSTYLTGDIPVGSYDPNRLVNLGIGHGAIDAGGGYTYLNQKTGREFSAISGLTYNFENPDTHYKNGVDWHLDWGASQFLSERVHAGLVGYWFQQISGDSGAGAKLGSFESRVGGIGPQGGYFFPVGGMQGYVNLKGYWEFAAQNRAEGWNVWLTFALSPASK
jgi:hypothetical protein